MVACSVVFVERERDRKMCTGASRPPTTSLTALLAEQDIFTSFSCRVFSSLSPFGAARLCIFCHERCHGRFTHNENNTMSLIIISLCGQENVYLLPFAAFLSFVFFSSSLFFGKRRNFYCGQMCKIYSC